MHGLWLGFLFALGACVGSFLNVVIYRLPRGQSILVPARSFCPRCGRQIRSWDNLPILSWLILRGRCRDCSAPIPVRYLLVELAGAVLLSGLYAAYYLAGLRAGAGEFAESWPMFAAHATLLFGLLACSVVDAEFFLVPLEVLWVCAAAGVVSAAAAPHPFLLASAVGPTLSAMAAAAMLGLGLSNLLAWRGWLQRSFLDAEDPPIFAPEPPAQQQPSELPQESGPDETEPPAPEPVDRTEPAPVGYTRGNGVNPRREILREVIFLLPAGILAAGAWAVLEYLPGCRATWAGLFDAAEHPALSRHLLSVGASIYGLAIGGLWIWGTRILGTLGFGREAMGMGDVHLLAAVGAVCGWIVPTLVFFLAPFLGLIWAVLFLLSRSRRELPYGPWLAAATMTVLLAYDPLTAWLEPLARSFAALAGP